MKIHSNFHDYYDGVVESLSQGADDIHYVRMPELINISGTQKFWKSSNTLYTSDIRRILNRLAAFVEGFERNQGKIAYPTFARIVFCGQVYYAYCLDSDDPNQKFHYSQDSFYEAGLELIKKRSRSRGESKARREEWDDMFSVKSGGYRKMPYISIGLLTNTDDDRKIWGHIGEDHDICTKHNTPVVVMPFFGMRRYVTTRMMYPPETKIGAEKIKENRDPNTQNYLLPPLKNAQLSYYNFQSIFDPYTAFQELEMYLGSLLTREHDVPVTVSDETRIAAHGFDTTYGFRTRPKK